MKPIILLLVMSFLLVGCSKGVETISFEDAFEKVIVPTEKPPLIEEVKDTKVTFKSSRVERFFTGVKSFKITCDIYEVEVHKDKIIIGNYKHNWETGKTYKKVKGKWKPCKPNILVDYDFSGWSLYQIYLYLGVFPNEGAIGKLHNVYEVYDNCTFEAVGNKLKPLSFVVDDYIMKVSFDI